MRRSTNSLQRRDSMSTTRPCSATEEVAMRLPVKLRFRAAGSFTVLALVCVTQQARADIKSDTDHPIYSFELEPHLAIAPFDEDQVGIGAGVTGTFNVVPEG